MRTARDWRVPPTTFWGGNGRRWTDTDRLLAQALTVLEQDVHRCGHPLSRSANPDMQDAYEVDAEVVCWACAAEAQFRKDNKELPDGAIVRVLDTRPADEPLPEWEPPDVEG